MFSRAKSSISKCKNHIIFKLLPIIWIRLEQIHVFKTSLAAELTVSLFISLSKVILSLFGLANSTFTSRLIFPCLSVLTCIDFIFLEHSHAFLLNSILLSSWNLINSLYTRLCLCLGLAINYLRAVVQFLVSLCSPSSIHPRTVSCIQWTLDNSIDLISRQDYMRPFPFIAWYLMKAVGSLKLKLTPWLSMRNQSLRAKMNVLSRYWVPRKG